MFWFQLIFWMSTTTIFYTYIGYGLLVIVLLYLRRRNRGSTAGAIDTATLPEVTILVAAFNESDVIDEKVKNCLLQNYPPKKLKLLFITDGSTDDTPARLKKYMSIKLLHRSTREGKSSAVNRAMNHVNTPVVIFSDANAMLNHNAVKNIVRHYRDPQVGGVAGEKRIRTSKTDSASGAGEGLYWKYESFLKMNDSSLYSTVGAAGELFSIRTALFTPLESDTLLDDFMIALRIGEKGYRVLYEPQAFAVEDPSASVHEEMKRKIRISAGGIQSILRLTTLLKIKRYGLLTFQYVSHRVFRWTVTPVSLILLFITNLFLINSAPFYQVIALAQGLFYTAAIAGWILERKAVKVKALFIPFYFCMMNLSVFIGMYRLLRGRQGAIWEKAKRSTRLAGI